MAWGFPPATLAPSLCTYPAVECCECLTLHSTSERRASCVRRQESMQSCSAAHNMQAIGGGAPPPPPPPRRPSNPPPLPSSAPCLPSPCPPSHACLASRTAQQRACEDRAGPGLAGSQAPPSQPRPSHPYSTRCCAQSTPAIHTSSPQPASSRQPAPPGTSTNPLQRAGSAGRRLPCTRSEARPGPRNTLSKVIAHC